MRVIGTEAKGIRMPIIKAGDALADIVVQQLIIATENHGFTLENQDIVAVTESIVAKAQNNFASVDHIATHVKEIFGNTTVGVVFPILSRNRFESILKGLSMGAEKLIIQLSYPSDEVGNHLVSLDMLDEKGVNPYTDSFTEAEFREIFGYETKHPFTGVDYIEMYKAVSPNIEIVFSNNPTYILNYTNNVICADVHSSSRTLRDVKRALSSDGKAIGLHEVLNKSIDGSGYNPQYGLLGSNKSSQTELKLFPRDSQIFVESLQEKLATTFGKHLEVLVYGDGAFKDPKGGIWELADPVVSPGFTAGLVGTPSEIKLKYVADNDYANLSGKDLEHAIRENIKNKADNTSIENSLGTTPRQITDLLGSLSDLISGSGDKGTPVVLIQGYFDDFSAQ